MPDSSSSSAISDFEISNPSLDEIEETLQLAFAHLPPEERWPRLEAILPQFRRGALSLDGVFQARCHGRRVGALYSQKRLDGTVLLWAPTVLEGFSAEPFFEPLRRYCRQTAATAAIALVDRGQTPDRPALEKAGFEYLSDMLYLVLTISGNTAGDAAKNTPASEDGLRFLPMSEATGDAFGRMMEIAQATYQNTRDFPPLLQILSARDILENCRDSAPFSPELWFFVRKDDRDIGLLLLSDASNGQIELTYMGLVEEARGFGYGREIVRFAARLARSRNADHLLTSVDEQNPAALHSYLSQGFRAWDRKNLYAWFFE